MKCNRISFFPGTRKKLRGIKIPIWDEVLKLAVDCQFAVPKLGFMRVDITLQPSLKKPGKTFPKVLELNAQPGLKIQLANRVGLKRRLQRVEGLKVETADKGIRIAKALFYSSKLRNISFGKRNVKVFEEVKVQPFYVGQPTIVKAKIDTGAYRTSIDEALAQRLGLLNKENILFEKDYRSSLGSQTRPVIELVFWLGGKKIKTAANTTDRSRLRRPMIIGRRDLKGFVVEPEHK